MHTATYSAIKGNSIGEGEKSRLVASCPHLGWILMGRKGKERKVGCIYARSYYRQVRSTRHQAIIDSIVFGDIAATFSRGKYVYFRGFVMKSVISDVQ